MNNIDNNKNNNLNRYNGINYIYLLTIVFITLKLIGEITWSWIWVLSPYWIGLILGTTFMLILKKTGYM